jgi:3-oxoadipate CoA-transferase alpha subunit
MVSKLFPSPPAAPDGIRDGATVMVGGFGGAGQPNELIEVAPGMGFSSPSLSAGWRSMNGDG